MKHRMILLSIAVPAALVFLLTASLQTAAHRHLPFSKNTVCTPLSIVVREERLANSRRHPAPALEDGDILVTKCTHSFGWRHGHAALVIDAANGLTLEAVTLGVPSAAGTVEGWRSYPSFTVLRLKGADLDLRRQIARHAAKELDGLPYRLTSGLWGEKLAVPPQGSQCAYLVWYAYAYYGYDLDGDGGKLVTVDDLLQSPLLEAAAEFM